MGQGMGTRDETSEKSMSRRHIIPRPVHAEAISRWGDSCWLGLPGCTGKGEEDDHIVPWSHGGRDTVDNIRRACKHCNASRSDRSLNGYGVDMHCVIGPPFADLEEYAMDNASDDAIVVSMPRLMAALSKTGCNTAIPPDQATRPARQAWTAAYNAVARAADDTETWVIRSIPRSQSHPQMLDEWIQLAYGVHVVDPGIDETMRRLHNLHATTAQRRLAAQWYAMHITQESIDTRIAQRTSKLASLGLARDSAPPARPSW